MIASQVNFGKYTFVRRLASGGMADIFLARQEGMAGFAREVVIKCIHEHLGNDEDFVTMFLDEARLVAYLNHPNIVSTHEFGQEDSIYYLVMEYVRGPSVVQLIEDTKGVEAAHALRIASEMCAGLDYAHSLRDETGKSMGIVHRDVSPPNVLIGYDGSVKLIDFGVSRAATHLHETRAGGFKGKYPYMAPEQAYGQAADHLSDLHSVGIVLWEMLTGEQLFERKSVFQTMEAVLNHVPPSVAHRCPQLGPRIDHILGKALAKDPAERFANCGELQNAIDELAVEAGCPSSSLGLARYVRALYPAESATPPPENIPNLANLLDESVASADPFAVSEWDDVGETEQWDGLPEEYVMAHQGQHETQETEELEPEFFVGTDEVILETPMEPSPPVVSPEPDIFTAPPASAPSYPAGWSPVNVPPPQGGVQEPLSSQISAVEVVQDVPVPAAQQAAASSGAALQSRRGRLALTGRRRLLFVVSVLMGLWVGGVVLWFLAWLASLGS
jgi:serine/threonine protein kinase